MIENEAAASDPSKGEPSKPSERPRPQFGELAPEGWSWQPPAPPEQEPEQAPDAAGVAPQHPAPVSKTPQQPAASQYPAPTTPPHLNVAAPHAGKAPAAALRVDRRVTLSLLIFGLFGLFISINTLNAIPEALQMMHEQQGLADFVASESELRTIFIGTVSQVVLWAATAIWAWLRMQNSRRAFWIPLVGGVTSAVLLFVVVSMIAANDPQLMELYSSL